MRDRSRARLHVKRARRALALGATAIAGLVATGTAAHAHAVFIGAPSPLSANTQYALVMNVPHELDDGIYNIDVLIGLPVGWSALSCQAQTTWTCATGTQSGHPTVHFVKNQGAGPFQDETFQFAVRTGTVGGSAPIPTVQSYSDGTIARWIGTSGSPNPAPVLKVAAPPATTTTKPRTTTTRPSPPSTASTQTTTQIAASTTLGPPTTTTVDSEPTTSPSGISETTTDSSVTTTSTLALTATTLPTARTAAPATRDEGTNSNHTLPIVIAGLVGVGVITAALWRRRGATPPTSP